MIGVGGLGLLQHPGLACLAGWRSSKLGGLGEPPRVGRHTIAEAPGTLTGIRRDLQRRISITAAFCVARREKSKHYRRPSL